MTGVRVSHSKWQVERVRRELPDADVESILSLYNRQWHLGNGDTSRTISSAPA